MSLSMLSLIFFILFKCLLHVTDMQQFLLHLKYGSSQFICLLWFIYMLTNISLMTHYYAQNVRSSTSISSYDHLVN